jgi:hypothetical protein
MFKKFGIIIVILSIASLALLKIIWEDSSGIELYSQTPVIKAYRVSQNLGGSWDSFSSLREAWVHENEVQDKKSELFSGVIRQNSIILPSDQGFRVAAKRFKVSGLWGSSTVQLVLNGVNGKVRVFINGIDEVNYLGEFEGFGNTVSVEIPPLMLNYQENNILYLEMLPGDLPQKKTLGWLWPDPGRITGRIELEAAPETTIDVSETTVSYRAKEQQVVVHVSLKHHHILKYGPWSLSGIVKENDNAVGECVLPVNSNGEYNQNVDLVFHLPQAKLWTLETPFLYQLDLTLTNNQGNTDRVQMPFGIKYNSGNAANWSYNDKKFTANAQIISRKQAYYIRNSRQVDNYLESAKNQGYNVVYFMGFFPDETWLYAADRIGIGVWLELPVAFAPEQQYPGRANLKVCS